MLAGKTGHIQAAQDERQAIIVGDEAHALRIQARIGPQPVVEVRHHRRITQAPEQIQQAQAVGSPRNTGNQRPAGLQGAFSQQGAL